MPKMYHFKNKFSKIVKHWEISAPALLNFQFWWAEVTYFGLIVFFQADYDEIELQKINYDIIFVTYSPLRYQKTSPK